MIGPHFGAHNWTGRCRRITIGMNKDARYNLRTNASNKNYDTLPRNELAKSDAIAGDAVGQLGRGPADAAEDVAKKSTNWGADFT